MDADIYFTGLIKEAVKLELAEEYKEITDAFDGILSYARDLATEKFEELVRQHTQAHTRDLHDLRVRAQGGE